MKILVLHPGGLGDIILSLPAVALIRKRYPLAEITMAGNIDHLSVVGRAYADRITALSTLPLHHLYVSGKLCEEDVRFWTSFDRIVSWTGWGDAEFEHNLKRIHPDARIVSWRPVPGETRHVSQLFVDSLGSEFRLPGGLPKICIAVDGGARQWGMQWLGHHGFRGEERLIALHPGAGSVAKRWPIGHFIELALRLSSIRNIKLLIIEGPAEPGISVPIMRALTRDVAIPVSSVSLNLLAALLAQCKVFAGNDSGIAHLAAGLNVPSVVLFGPTLPEHWAPLGESVRVLREAHGCQACALGDGAHSCLDHISVADVHTALVQALEFQGKS